MNIFDGLPVPVKRGLAFTVVSIYWFCATLLVYSTFFDGVEPRLVLNFVGGVFLFIMVIRFNLLTVSFVGICTGLWFGFGIAFPLIGLLMILAGFSLYIVLFGMDRIRRFLQSDIDN